MLLRRTAAVASLVLGISAAVLITWAAQAQSPSQPRPAVSSPRDYPVQPVPFTAVHLDDGFWAPRIETNRAETIPFAFKQCELSGRVDNFIRAAKALRGEPLGNTKPPGYPFDDTDLYKVIEGASYALSVHPDPKLDAYVDSLIEKIAAAQEKDGYLYTTRTINPASPHPWAGRERWELERDTATSCTTWVICTKRPSRITRPRASARCWTSRSAPPICSSRRSARAGNPSG